MTHLLKTVIGKDLKPVREISYDMSRMIIEESHTIQVQRFLKDLREHNLWVKCSCADNAILYPRIKDDFICLVRMPSRGDHADDCHYSELNMKIRRVKFVEELKGNRVTFHRVAPEPSGLVSKPNINAKANPSEVSKLGRYLLTVYNKAGLNYVPLVGTKRKLTDQYRSMRLTLSATEVAGKEGKDVIFTHPDSYPKAIAKLYKDVWHAGQVPQVLLFFTVDSIADKEMTIRTNGSDTLNLTSVSKIEYVYSDKSPPYNVLMTLCLKQDAEEPQILKSVAIPILNKGWLLPVRNNDVRIFTRKMMERAGQVTNEFYRKQLSRYTLLTPFFAQEMEGVKFRPDFYIEEDGAGYVAIYFVSKSNDENYHARTAEMEFLRSIEIRVVEFDTDRLYNDRERALDMLVTRIFEEHLPFKEPRQRRYA